MSEDEEECSSCYHMESYHPMGGQCEVFDCDCDQFT